MEAWLALNSKMAKPLCCPFTFVIVPYQACIRIKSADCVEPCGGLGSFGFDPGAFTHVPGQTDRSEAPSQVPGHTTFAM